MSRDVKITITAAKNTVSSGFGYPLIFEGKATKAIDYSECESIEDVIRVVGGITASDTAETIATKTEAAKKTDIYKAAVLMLMQKNAPSKIAVCATTTAATDGLATIVHHDWRQLVVVSLGKEGEDTASAISDYIKGTEKMFFTSAETVSAAAETDSRQTAMLIHDDPNGVVFPEAGVVGATAGKPAGSFTYKFTEIKGLTPAVISDTDLNAIHSKNCIAYILDKGYGMLSEGITTNGEYIDNVDSEDYVVQNIEKAVQHVLVKNDKVPYDNVGISMLENAVVSVLKDAANNGIILIDDNGVPDFSVTFKVRSETKEADRQARRYVEGYFRFTLAGAIHSVEITGTIEI